MNCRGCKTCTNNKSDRLKEPCKSCVYLWARIFVFDKNQKTSKLKI